MGIYSFWIFDRHCNCIFDREWTLASNSASGTINSKQNEDDAKLLYGMIFSLRYITQKLSKGSVKNDIRSISTGKYRVHTYCTASGLWFVLLSDFKQQSYTQVLQYIYSHIYVKYVSNNLLSPYDFAENENEMRGQGTRKITNRNFISVLESFLAPMVNQ
ncbi:AVN_HP_G0081110.mRNA.1.CDS.1 [Saccharomyces cerevisiae]|nr:AVN_HP_G0017680.mRNA.1.CDS.1 [Saccharomyces cerevisiae]CAI4996466.1 AVN_HP_G0039980.mRNA.1.CDS.1 [Saccharomyces cerevisiae]CAI5023486.1 AVN_HP_G0064230.mRNA.1.CDS.1 [Saccharomyces cerevisiae]CAI5053564.1 AVN_HP_G0081110.mRNA.1.CDS.1 [Saccharomyces cerevisiae]CAI6717373.1 AVN_HP_G0017680.mRNA.1.CDS.1 [Saccharomyces cerevisiae]